MRGNPTLPPRYVRRHLLVLDQPATTRRQRKAQSKAIRLYLKQRGSNILTDKHVTKVRATSGS